MLPSSSRPARSSRADACPSAAQGGGAGISRAGSRRRGRPTAALAAAIDQAILQAALELFLECGYQRATMAALAERAGVSKGTLYGRYAGKEAVFRGVVKDRLDRWSATNSAGDHALPAGLAPRLRVHARTMHRMLDTPEYAQITRLVETSAIAFPDIAAFWHVAGMQKFVGLLAHDMASSAGIPESADLDWMFLANLFLHAFGSWHKAASATRQLTDAEAAAFADQVIATILTVVAAAGAAPAGASDPAEGPECDKLADRLRQPR